MRLGYSRVREQLAVIVGSGGQSRVLGFANGGSWEGRVSRTLKRLEDTVTDYRINQLSCKVQKTCSTNMSGTEFSSSHSGLLAMCRITKAGSGDDQPQDRRSRMKKYE